jgi:hypothetical protein
VFRASSLSSILVTLETCRTLRIFCPSLINFQNGRKILGNAATVSIPSDVIDLKVGLSTKTFLVPYQVFSRSVQSLERNGWISVKVLRMPQ